MPAKVPLIIAVMISHALSFLSNGRRVMSFNYSRLLAFDDPSFGKLSQQLASPYRRNASGIPVILVAITYLYLVVAYV
jgi:hypothetical protein